MSKNFKVWCNTDDELNEVLTRAGRDGFTWASGGNPIDYKILELEVPVGIIFMKGRIYYAGTRESFDDPRAEHIDEISAQYYTQFGSPVDIDMDNTVDTDMKKTVELTRGKLLEVFETVSQSDESTKKLFMESPLIYAVIGVMLVKIEDELFKDEPDNKLFS